MVGDEVFAGAVGLDDGGHHVLGDMVVVGQELLGVFGQAVAAVAEGGVVVVGADARIQTDAFDDGLGVEAFDLGVGVEFIEVTDTQGQVGVGEEFDGFGFFQAHEQGRDVLLDGAFLQEMGKLLGGFAQMVSGDGADGGVLFVLAVNHLGVTDDDSGGVEVVVQGLGLAQELGGEEEAEFPRGVVTAFFEESGVFDVEGTGVTDGDGGFDDHGGLGVDGENQVDDLFDVGGVEVVFDGVVVCGGGDDYEFGVSVRLGAVEGGGQVQGLLLEVLFDVLVLDG